MSAAGEFSTTAGEGLGFSNADIAANAFGTGTTMSAANTAVGGLGSGFVEGLGSALDLGAGAFNLGAPGISAAAEGVLGLGDTMWAGLSPAGSNVGFSAVPELGYITGADFPLTPGSPGIPAGTTELGGEFVTGLPGGGGSITVPDIGTPGLDDAVTNVVDNAFAGIGPNSADVINSIPGSNPAPPGSGGSRWDKLTDAAKKPFMDPDGTVNWSRVAQAGLFGANVLGGALGGSPDGGVLTGGSNYVAPDWVSGGIPDSPDPGQYMQRGGEWTPGMTVNEQAELLARGVAAPKDYTQNEGSRRMTRDPSLATLPTRPPPGAGVPGSPVGGGAVRGRGSPGLRVGPPPVDGVPGSPATGGMTVTISDVGPNGESVTMTAEEWAARQAENGYQPQTSPGLAPSVGVPRPVDGGAVRVGGVPAPESNIPDNVASALRGERGFDPEITSFLQRAHGQADSGLPFADWIGTIAASRGGTVPTNFDFLGEQPSPPQVRPPQVGRGQEGFGGGGNAQSAPVRPNMPDNTMFQPYQPEPFPWLADIVESRLPISGSRLPMLNGYTPEQRNNMMNILQQGGF
jgi:hypothetical protein